MRPSSMRHRSLKNSSRSRAPLDLFSAVRETPERPADRRLAHRNPARGKEELGPLGVGGPRPPFEISYEEPSRLLVQLRGLAWSLPRLQGVALLEKLAVAFYGGAIDPEAAGGLGLGDTPFFTDSTTFSVRSSEHALMHP